MSDRGRVRNITDLARLADVSPGTVSRALADSKLIAKKTRERIQQLARDHDFRPNVMARNLRIRRAGAIGVLMPLRPESGERGFDSFLIDMLGHLADELTERGHGMLLFRIIPEDPDSLSRAVDSGRVDGVIVIDRSDRLENIEGVASRDQPLVAWGTNSPNAKDLATVAMQLVDLLFRRIAGETTGPVVFGPEFVAG